MKHHIVFAISYVISVKAATSEHEKRTRGYTFTLNDDQNAYLTNCKISNQSFYTYRVLSKSAYWVVNAGGDTYTSPTWLWKILYQTCSRFVICGMKYVNKLR